MARSAFRFSRYKGKAGRFSFFLEFVLFTRKSGRAAAVTSFFSNLSRRKSKSPVNGNIQTTDFTHYSQQIAACKCGDSEKFHGKSARERQSAARILRGAPLSEKRARNLEYDGKATTVFEYYPMTRANAPRLLFSECAGAPARARARTKLVLKVHLWDLSRFRAQALHCERRSCREEGSLLAFSPCRK